MTTEASLEHAIRQIAAAELGHSEADLTLDQKLRDAPGVESVKLLRIIATVEERYEVELDDEVVFGEIQSIRDLAEAVRPLLTGADVAVGE